MKTIFTFAFLILVSCLGIKAQRPITVSEDSLKFGKSILPCQSVTIPEANYEKTLKIWIKEMESKTKSRVITENDEMSIFGASIKAISPDPVNVYSKLIRLDSMLKLLVSFELKKDQYIERSSGEAEFAKAENYLKEFAKNQYIEVVKDQVDTEEKKLRDIKKELSSLENEKSRMQKSIQSDNSSIVNEKANITVQNNELATVLAALVEQKALLTSMESGPAQKEKAEQVKDLEKRKRKAQNSIESSENKINRANSSIDKATGDIPRNERMQTNVKEQIALQEEVCQRYADKLKAIKSY